MFLSFFSDFLIQTLTALATPYITTSERFFKNPLVFNPRRWLKNDENYENMHPYAFLPFGFGTRMCIGRRLVEQEIYVYLAKVSIF
jgi:cholestanetriol 26-monooxygenase